MSLDLIELLWKDLGADAPTDEIKALKETYFNEGVINYEKFLVFFNEVYVKKIDKTTLLDAFQFLKKGKIGTIPT